MSGLARSLARGLSRGLSSGLNRNASGSTRLFDTRTDGLVGLYWLNLALSSHTGSPLIRVRRSSDNAETDIGHDANGDLDTTTLLTFVGANDGFVATWYDQTVNSRDLSQSVAATQPRIVAAGVLDAGLMHTGTQYLDAPASLYGALDSPADYGAMFWMYRTDGVNNRDPIGFRTAARLVIYCPSDDGANTFTARSVNDTGTEAQTPSITYTPGAWAIYGHSLDRVSLETVAYYEAQTQSITGSGTYADAFSAGRVGSAPLSGGLSGMLAGLALYSTADIGAIFSAVRNTGSPNL